MAEETVKSEPRRQSLASRPFAQSSSVEPLSAPDFTASELHPPHPSLRPSQVLVVACVRFVQQPPDNLRKSNFFSFSLSLLSNDHQPVTVKSARFAGFTDDRAQCPRNGIIYKLILKSSRDTTGAFTLVLRIVDSANKQLVAFEGGDKNPDYRRVLLTHTSTCARCSEGKPCGNEKYAPADPVIEKDGTGTVLKFFLRCNQNGAQTGRPGRPKQSGHRMFQVQVETDLSILGYSEAFFVHNSSKYGKVVEAAKVKTLNPNTKEECKPLNTEPAVFSLSPLKGTAGTELILLGENFTADLDVFLGPVRVTPALSMPHAIKVIVPDAFAPGCVKVTLVSETKNVLKESPVSFIFIGKELQSPLLNLQISMLGRMLPKNFTAKLGRPLTSNSEILNQVAWFIEWFRSTECSYSGTSTLANSPSSITMISPPTTPPTEESYPSSADSPLSDEDSFQKTYTTLTTFKNRYHPYGRPLHQPFSFLSPLCSSYAAQSFSTEYSQYQVPKNCSQESFASHNFWRPG